MLPATKICGKFIRQPTRKKIFYDHKARHSVVKEFFSVWSLFKPFLNIKKRQRSENKTFYYIKEALNVVNGLAFSANNVEIF